MSNIIMKAVHSYLSADGANSLDEVHAVLRGLPHQDIADQIIAGDESQRDAVLAELAEILSDLNSRGGCS